MTPVQLLRCAAVLTLAAAACSTSSSGAVRDGGRVTGDSGDDASADATEIDSSEPVDGTTGDSEPDSSPGPPVDAAPVDAAYACANPTSVSDCAYCQTRKACLSCATTGAGGGAAALQLKSVLECVDCYACYNACSGSAVGCSQPASADPCDSLGPNPSECVHCEACAVMGANSEAGAGSCSGQQATCVSTPGCGQLLGATEAACKNLP